MTEANVDQYLNSILKKTQSAADYNLLPDEIAFLTSAFLSSRSDVTTIKPKAYVALSAFCQGVREKKGKGKDPEVATRFIVNVFSSKVVECLGETDEKSLMTGITFLTALFQVDQQAASSIFGQDGLIENMMDAVDLTPSDLLCQDVAHLLGQACGHKACRTIMTPQISRWLEFKSGQSPDPILKSAATVALIKLNKGLASDNPENGAASVRDAQTDDLTQKLVDVFTNGQTTSYSDAVEGLAYLSTDPIVKETLSKDSTFLKKLFSLVSFHKNQTVKLSLDQNSTLVFGIILIVCNLTSFRPRITEEQKQMEKLKQMAKANKDASSMEDKSLMLDDDDHVKARIRRLISFGLLPIFPSAVAAASSFGIRQNVGKCLLNVVEEKENRGKVLQTGGAKVLQSIIKQAISNPENLDNKKNTTISLMDLEAIQALAKLAITSSPVQVFGPDVGKIYDSIRPLSLLLQHPSSNSLQQFEAIMSLTNLASHSPEVASRIGQADGLLNKVELLLLEDHVLIRRASTELVCNLIAGSDEVFERYSGASQNSANKLHILLALSDESDLATRLAASGALATLTVMPTACEALIALQFDKHRYFTLMTQLIDPSVLDEEEEEPLATDPGLVHRGVVCVCNVFKSISEKEVREKVTQEATKSSTLKALGRLIAGEGVVKDQMIVQQAAEGLKALIDTK